MLIVRIRIEYCIYLSRKLLVIFKCKINLGKKIKKIEILFIQYSNTYLIKNSMLLNINF